MFPAQLGTIRLYKFVPKLLMINIGGLYQPITLYATGWKGDLLCLVSGKEFPDESTFEFEVENGSCFKYPRGMDSLRPEALRFSHDKVLFLSFESTEECALTLSLFQNSFTDVEKQIVDERFAGKLPAKPKVKEAQPEKQEGLIGETRKRIDTMLGKDLFVEIHPAKEAKRVKEKITQMIRKDETPADFLELIEELKTQRRDNQKTMISSEGQKDWVMHNATMLH